MRVNYDSLSTTYHNRYKYGNDLAGVSETLLKLVNDLKAEKVLEVGCGTGRWLNVVQPIAQVYGLDFSLGMLTQAHTQYSLATLARGTALYLPYTTAQFDLVFCVNALHHFVEPQKFFTEAYRILKPDGVLVSINVDPHHSLHNWYIYDYFPRTRAIDQQRFTPLEIQQQWLQAAGFTRTETKIAHALREQRLGQNIFDDHFTQKHSSSQLALLTDEEYAQGIARLKTTVANNPHTIFKTELDFVGVWGFK